MNVPARVACSRNKTTNGGTPVIRELFIIIIIFSPSAAPDRCACVAPGPEDPDKKHPEENLHHRPTDRLLEFICCLTSSLHLCLSLSFSHFCRFSVMFRRTQTEMTDKVKHERLLTLTELKLFEYLRLFTIGCVLFFPCLPTLKVLTIQSE